MTRSKESTGLQHYLKYSNKSATKTTGTLDALHTTRRCSVLKGFGFAFLYVGRKIKTVMSLSRRICCSFFKFNILQQSLVGFLCGRSDQVLNTTTRPNKEQQFQPLHRCRQGNKTNWEWQGNVSRLCVKTWDGPRAEVVRNTEHPSCPIVHSYVLNTTKLGDLTCLFLVNCSLSWNAFWY